MIKRALSDSTGSTAVESVTKVDRCPSSIISASLVVERRTSPSRASCCTSVTGPRPVADSRDKSAGKMRLGKRGVSGTRALIAAVDVSSSSSEMPQFTVSVHVCTCFECVHFVRVLSLYEHVRRFTCLVCDYSVLVFYQQAN
jgi:hypothetical protein